MPAHPSIVPCSIHERALLIDTSALYALFDPSDGHHSEASTCLKAIAANSLAAWVTNATIMEAHRLVSQRLGGAKGLRLLTTMYAGDIAIERATEVDEGLARGYVEKYADLSVSYTDGVSFAVMKRLGIGTVFAFDWHFTLLGFTIIPPLWL